MIKYPFISQSTESDDTKNLIIITKSENTSYSPTKLTKLVSQLPVSMSSPELTITEFPLPYDLDSQTGNLVDNKEVLKEIKDLAKQAKVIVMIDQQFTNGRTVANLIDICRKNQAHLIIMS